MSPTGSEGRLRRPISSATGLSLLARIVWYRGKAKINHLLDYHSTPKIPAKSSILLPYELVEIIIAHLIDDPPTLKACSLTCYSWYIAAVPHIYRTFVLKGVDNRSLKALLKRHALGLSPFIKEIRILQPVTKPRWFLPQNFSHLDSCQFFSLANVQSLTVQYLDIYRFIPGLGRYFGHLSPTLRSLTLESPHCSALQLSHFISMFPNLDDVEIRFFARMGNIPEEKLPPLSSPKFRGQLTLLSFTAVETWEHLAASCSLRFHSIHLRPVTICAPFLLVACADTLETLRIDAAEHEWFVGPSIRDYNLSSLKVLRSLQIKPLAFLLLTPLEQEVVITTIELLFLTITSHVFAELAFVVQYGYDGNPCYFPGGFFDALRRMYGVRPFRLAFLVIAPRNPIEAAMLRERELSVSTIVDQGFLSFLDSPPSIRFTR